MCIFACMQMKISDIATLVKGSVDGDPEAWIYGPSGIENAVSGTITFLSDDKYIPYLSTCEASAVLVSENLEINENIKPTLIRVHNVGEAIQLLLTELGTASNTEHKISQHTVVSPSAHLGQNVGLGDFTIVKENVSIGDHTMIDAQVYIGANVKIGKHCTIFPGVRIYNATVGDRVIIHANTVIGEDGFGYKPNEQNEYQKIPHFGNVIIEDDVEVGSNVVVDRGTFGSTIIRKGVKLDNLIQIAHNVEIGPNTVVAAQSGVAGSTKIGANCRIGGQVGIVGHIDIAEGTEIQAQSGVAAPVVKKKTKLYGSPAIDYWNYLRSYALFKNLPKLVQELRQLKKRVDQLDQPK